MQRQQQERGLTPYTSVCARVRVQERMVSSATSSGDTSMTVDFTKYSVTTARLEPAATLAFAATQSQDPTMSLVAASFAELVRQINMDIARLRTMRERVEEASKVMSDFAKVYGINKPVPPPSAAGGSSACSMPSSSWRFCCRSVWSFTATSFLNNGLPKKTPWLQTM